jgi:hypothetical protein
LQAEKAEPGLAEPDLLAVQRRADRGLTVARSAVEQVRSRLAELAGRRVAGETFDPLPRLVPGDRLDIRQQLLFTALAPTRTWSGWDGDAWAWEVLQALDIQALSPWFGWYWSGWESEDQVLEPDRVGAMAGVLADQGMPMLVWLEPAYNVGGLWEEIGAEMYLHAADGTWRRDTRINNTINVFHPRVRDAMCAWLEGLAVRYRDDPRILAYELVEESALRFDVADPRSADHEPRYGGYSGVAIQGFRERLRSRHGDISRLNRLWGTAYASFADVVPPTELSRVEGDWTGPEAALLAEFQAYRAVEHAECFRRMVAALHRGDPERPVLPQFVTPLFGDPLGGVDLFRMGEAGWDVVTFHTDTARAYMHSVARYAGKPIWNDEYIWSGRVPRRETGEKRLRAYAAVELWRDLMWGAQGFVLFNLDFAWDHPKDDGDWNNDLLNVALGSRVPRYAAAVLPQILRKVPTFFDDLYRSEVVDEGVLVLEPTTSVYTSVPTGTTQWWGRRLARELEGTWYRPRFCPERYLVTGQEDLSDIDVVLVPFAPSIPEAVAGRLAAWVEDGGVLITMGPFAVRDAVGRARSGPAPFGGQSAGASLTLGQGRYVNVPLQGTPDRIAEAVRVAVDSAVGPRAVTATDPRLELMLRTRGARRLLVVLNPDAESTVGGRVRVDGRFSRITDVTVEGHMPVPLCVSDDGRSCEIPVHLMPGEARVFVLVTRSLQ